MLQNFVIVFVVVVVVSLVGIVCVVLFVVGVATAAAAAAVAVAVAVALVLVAIGAVVVVAVAVVIFMMWILFYFIFKKINTPTFVAYIVELHISNTEGAFWSPVFQIAGKDHAWFAHTIFVFISIFISSLYLTITHSFILSLAFKSKHSFDSTATSG